METRAQFYNNIKPFLTFDKTIGADVGSDKTIDLIIKTINSEAINPVVINWAKIIGAGKLTTAEFCKRLFYVACANVQYLRDPAGHEIIFTPSLLMKVGRGDCKKFTVFIGSVLKAAGIPCIIKVVSYDGKSWAHVYIIVPLDNTNKNYITMDPVNHCKFNSEVNYSKAQNNFLNYQKSNIMDGNKLSLMGGLGNLNTSNLLSGIGDSAGDVLADIDATFNGVQTQAQGVGALDELAGLGNEYINGINDELFISGNDDIGKRARAKANRGGKPKKTKEERKARRKKLFHFGAKVNFLPIRAAFLSLVKLGGALQKIKGLKINLAKKLAEAYARPEVGAQLNKIWYKFGGEEKTLKQAIVQAGKSKLHGTDELSGPEIAAYNDMLSGLGVAPAVAAAAVITAATPILIPVINMLKKNKVVSPQAAEAAADVAETAEDIAHSTRGGKLTAESVAVLTKSPLMRRSLEEEQESQTQMPQGAAVRFEPPAAEMEQAETAQTMPEDFKKGSADAGDTTDKTAAANQPDATASATSAKSFGAIYAPTTYLKTLFLIAVIAAMYQQLPKILITFATTAAALLFIATTINLIYKRTKKQHYGKNQI